MAYPRLRLMAFVSGVWLACFSAYAYAEAKRTRNCSEEARENINQAIDYMELNMDTLRHDYDFDTFLPRRDDRVKRRMAREIDQIAVHCAERFLCRIEHRYGYTRGSAITDRINICYENVRTAHPTNFCFLVGIVAHEYAHMIRMPSQLGHNFTVNLMDAPYMFGWFVQDLCTQDRLRRVLADFSTPLPPPNPQAPTSGIILFPHADFRGRGRPFPLQPVHRPLDKEFSDLRWIGRNDAVSSLKVLSGNWELCEHPAFRGWCRVFSEDELRLSARRFHDRVSSLRPVTLPRRGITVFQHENFEGGSRNFTAAHADVSEIGINNRISSVQVHDGRWELCSNADFRRCVIVDRDQTDLRHIGLENRISSLRPAQEWGIDRPGSDFASFDLPDPDPERCRVSCESEEHCQAWTYVHPGIQGPAARCWLKEAVPDPVENACCVSGVSDYE